MAAPPPAPSPDNIVAWKDIWAWLGAGLAVAIPAAWRAIQARRRAKAESPSPLEPERAREAPVAAHDSVISIAPETILPREMRVLLVDDHDLFRKSLRLLLDSRGVRVIGEASTGEEAVKLALELRPDAILMDVKMPSGAVNGIEATRQIKATWPEAKIIALAGNGLEEVIECIKAGAMDYLVKNAKIEEVLRALAKIAT